MSREAGRSLTIAFAVILGSGFVVGTSASFNGSTKNGANTFSSAALTAPQTLAAAPSGADVALGFVAGSFGGGTGFGHRIMQRNMGVEPDPRDGLNPASGTCANTDTFTIAAGRTTAAVTTLTHTGAGATSVAGSYACYRADTEYPASPSTANWFSQSNNPVAMVMLGHVVKSVIGANGGDSGQIDQGDVFTITFNQPVNIATGPTSTNNTSGIPTTGNDICVRSTDGTIAFGRTLYNSTCTSSQGVVVGRLSGTTMSPSNEYPNYHATWSWADCPVAGQCRVLTATFGRRYRDNTDVNVTGITSPSFAPTTNANFLKSAAGNVVICNAANTATSTCRPVPTGTI